MNARKILFYTIAALLGGCLPVASIYPLFTPEDLIFEQQLLGRWTTDPNGPQDRWTFERAGERDNAYTLTITDRDGHRGSFLARLAAIDSRVFLDLLPDKPVCDIEDPNKADWPYNAVFMVRAHTFLKVESITPRVRIKMTQQEALDELLAEHPDAVQHTVVEDRTVLTAPTEQLQSFVTRYADDDRLFPDEIVLYPIQNKN